MADLTTLTGIEAELAATADYDVAVDVTKAKRRVAALRRRLDFPQPSGRGEQNAAFAIAAIENQLQQVLAWIAANETPSDASRLANPDVARQVDYESRRTLPQIARQSFFSQVVDGDIQHLPLDEKHVRAAIVPAFRSRSTTSPRFAV